jgi:hypothetical protein
MTLTFARRFLVAGAILALASVSAFADGLCDGQTLGQVVDSSLGSCTIGDKLFSNFDVDFTGPTGSPAVPSAADVVLSGMSGSSDTITFNFDTGDNTPSDSYALVAVGQELDLSISYLVTVTDYPSYEIGSIDGTLYASLSGDPTILDVLTGNADITYTGPGGAFLDFIGNAQSNSAIAPINDSGIPQGLPTILGVNASSYNVSDLVTVTGGTVSPSDPTEILAAVDSFSNQFNQINPESLIPEPATFLLLGSALLGLGVLRRKRA